MVINVNFSVKSELASKRYLDELKLYHRKISLRNLHFLFVGLHMHGMTKYLPCFKIMIYGLALSNLKAIA